MPYNLTMNLESNHYLKWKLETSSAQAENGHCSELGNMLCLVLKLLEIKTNCKQIDPGFNRKE